MSTPATDATVEAGALFLLIGAYPHTAWLPDVIGRDQAGYVLTGADLYANVRAWIGRVGPTRRAFPGSSRWATFAPAR